MMKEFDLLFEGFVASYGCNVNFKTWIICFSIF